LARLRFAAFQSGAGVGGEKHFQVAALLIVKILYVSQYFPPEMGAPSARVAELSRHWARMGQDVTVLTGFPNHPTGIVPREWRSRFQQLSYSENNNGFRVERSWLWPLPNRKAHERIRNYVSFFLSASFAGLSLPKPDVVIGTSPQLLCALAAWWLAAWHRVPFVFEVRDLWPESLAAVGAGGEKSFLYRTLGAIAGFLYRRAERIVAVTAAFKKHLIEAWNVPAAKIAVIENGVETDLFRSDPAAAEVRKGLSLGENHFLICYTGTMGAAQGLETLVAAAEELESLLPRARFLLVGEGAQKQSLIDLVARRKITNVHFLDQQPRERIPAIISTADLCVVMLKPDDLFRTVVPTKLLECMSCARPVLLAVDGEARQLMEEAGAGVFVQPGDSHALAEAICVLAQDAERRSQMGTSGRQYIVDRLSRERTAENYIQELEKVLQEWR
jgi:glycosyltransferase involved in cell wall biosynthesis